MEIKNLFISTGIALIGFNVLQSYTNVIPNKLIAILVIIGFGMAALGTTEYFFGNAKRKFTIQEIMVELAIIVGILIAITYFLPQFTFGNNVFIKQAFAG